MTERLALPVVYDAGALLAAERDDRRFAAFHLRALTAGREIVVPSPVLARVWRDGARQVQLARVLRGCRVEPTSEEVAKTAGVLMGRSRTADAVAAIVVAAALTLRASVVTGDPEDLRRIGAVAPSSRRLALITV